MLGSQWRGQGAVRAGGCHGLGSRLCGEDVWKCSEVAEPGWAGHVGCREISGGEGGAVPVPVAGKCTRQGLERGPVHEVVHGQGWRAVEQMHRAMHGFGLWHEYGTVQRQGPVSENERTMWSQGGTTEVERRQQGAQKGVGRMPEIYNKDVTRRLQGCHRDAMRRSRASREPVAI